MSAPPTFDLNAPEDFSPTRRLTSLHRAVVRTRVLAGELPSTAQLYALAFVATCATPEERRLLSGAGEHEGELEES
jgi:hypothetical protein